MSAPPSLELIQPLPASSLSSASDAIDSSGGQPTGRSFLAFPDKASESGCAVAETLIRRLIEPTAVYRVAVLQKGAPEPSAPRATMDAAYTGFVSSLPSSGSPLPKRIAAQRRLFETWVPWCLQWPLFFSGYSADAHVQRATAVVYLTLSVIAVVWRNSPWLWYVVAGLCADAGLRVVGGDRLAVLSCMCEWVTTFVPGSYLIASAPRQFAWLVYTILLFVACLVSGYVLCGDQDTNHVGFGTLLGLLAGCQALELAGLSLPALLFEKVLVPRGLISDAYIHKAEWIEAEKRLKRATIAARVALDQQALHSVVVSHADQWRTLLRFDGLVLAERTHWDPIRNLSIGYVFPLLGVAGLADMFFYAWQFAGINRYVWRSLAVLLGVLYLAFWGAQLLRAWLVPKVLLRELRHPHLRYAFMLALTVPLLSIDFMASVSIEFCHVIFWICAPLALLLTLCFVHDWIQQPHSFDLFNASWLIGIIVMIIAALELPIAYPELAELAWLWLAFGLFMWFIFMILLFARLFFSAPLPDSQRPALFLMMSTGAIGSAALIFQDPQAVNELAGPLSTAAEFMFWLTNSLALLCYFLLARAYFCRSPFNMSYWALSFPSAALALVWLFYWQVGNCDQAMSPTQYSSEERCTNNQSSHTVRGVVILCIVNASVGNSVLFANTVLAALQKRLFLPLPQWSPAVALQLHHFAFRVALYKASMSLGQLAPKSSTAAAPSTALVCAPARRSLYRHRLTSSELGLAPSCPCSACREHESEAVSSGERQEERLHELLDHLASLEIALCTYMDNKRDVLWPAVELWLPNVHIEHTDGSQLRDVRDKLHRLIGQIAALHPVLNDNSEQVAALVAECADQLTDVARAVHLHLDHEEVILTPLLHRFTDVPSANRIMRQLWDKTSPPRHRIIIPWLLNHLPDHPQRLAYVDCYTFATESAVSIMGRWMRDGLDPFLYRQLCVDYPRLEAGEPSLYSKFW